MCALDAHLVHGDLYADDRIATAARSLLVETAGAYEPPEPELVGAPLLKVLLDIA